MEHTETAPEPMNSSHPTLHKNQGDPVMDPSDNLHDPGGNPPLNQQNPASDSASESRAPQDAGPEEPSEDLPETGPKEEKSLCGRMCPCFHRKNKDTSRPNYKYIALMFAALFASSFTLTFLFPFLPDMVKWMGYSEEEKGYYVGLIASSVFAGRACGSFFWGWLSDVKGRKLVLLLTIAGNGIFSLLFGLSFNLPMAMVLRFLAGAANGTVGTAKTVLYEISDNTNQAIGMSAISLAWGCGLIIGPTVGGYLASPALKYSSVFSADGFFGQYPFFLPSLITMLVCCMGFAIILFKFEETLQKKLYDIEIREVSDDVDEVKPLTDKASISSSQINVCRSIESLHRGPLAAVSIEDVHCAAEAGTYFLQGSSEFQNHSAVNDKSLHSHSLSSQEKLDSDLVHRKVPDVTKHVTKTDSEDGESERDGLLNETAVSSFFNTAKDTSTTSLNKVGSSNPELSDVTKDSTDNQNICVNGKTDVSVKGQSNGVTGAHVKQDSVTIVFERQMASLKVKNKSKKSLSMLCTSAWHSICSSRMVSLMCVSDIRNSILLYTVFSFAVIGSEDVFTIFMSTDPGYNGLGFSSNEIGLSLGVVSVPLLCLNLIVFPLLVKKLEIKKTFMLWSVILVVTVQTLAMLHPLHDNPVVLWTLLMLILLPQRLGTTCCFSAASLMINNSCTPQTAGTVNGIAMTCTALARTLAPTVGGGVFAWSISYGAEHLGPPFDHNLIFLVFGIVFFISTIQCLLLPERLNKQTKKS